MKKRIAVIFGGRSAEHDVSIITAHIPIIRSLLATGTYEVWPLYISKDGSWYSDQRMNNIAYFTEHGLDERLHKQKKVDLSVSDGFEIIWPGFLPRRVKIDVVFPAMHGTYGEDGSLMGLLRLANVPFVGCSVSASAVAMDKVLTKQVAAADGLSVVPYVWFTDHGWNKEKEHYKEEIAKLTWPLFVKPVHLGSSIAITKVTNDKELENAVEVAFHYDTKVLVEESVEDLIEITLPIMGNDDLRPAELERPLNETEFFDFNEKYLSGSGKKGEGVNSQYSEVPARIGDELAAKVKEVGMHTYRSLGCQGIARVDMLIDNKTGKVYVNEVNTLPGSLYQHNWKKSGLSNSELVTELVRLAEERFAVEQDVTVTFSSDVLKRAGERTTI